MPAAPTSFGLGFGTRFGPRLGMGLAAVALCLACSTETPTSSAAAGDPGSVAADPGGGSRTIAVACQAGHTIDPSVRAAVEGQARVLVQALHDGKTDALWDELHPQARRDDQRQPFMDALSSMRDRLRGTSGEPQLESVHVVDLSGGANDLARVQCGAPDDPRRFTLMVNAGGEDVAVVVLRAPEGAPGSESEQAITVQLRQRGEHWHLLGIQVNPSTWQGKDAVGWEMMGDVYMSQQKVVMGYLLLGLAQTLSDRGASITSAMHARIEDKLAAIQRDRLFAAETGIWTVGDARFRIEGLSLVATRRDISPVIKYVSPQGLVEELLDRDADALVEEVRRRFPELQQHFDAVVFEAYAQVPSQPGQSYQAYRIVRFLDPTKARG
ncbi:hypothetical protein [Paraliomyxa miuraensis]|uniref:hypothetical protein n=1 Tax=Paraliomyxa miuraensis TaxID=376150 RepID=UPI002250A49A|nr:hypothetical protein [Paraliomyxa miuraensis]MCX4242944.1 hypothetical protein [Paraliomyxa miuraensis]